MATYVDIQAEFTDLTSKASQAVRTSAVAGIGAVWIVSQTHLDSKSLLFSHIRWFEFSAFAFILALAFDLLHAFVTSVVYWLWLNRIDRKYKGKLKARAEAKFEYPNLIRRTPWAFYWLKGLAVLAGTICLCGAVILTYSK